MSWLRLSGGQGVCATKAVVTLPCEQHRPVCAQGNVSLGCSDCQLGSCATGRDGQSENSSDAHLGDAMLVLNAKETLVPEK